MSPKLRTTPPGRFSQRTLLIAGWLSIASFVVFVAAIGDYRAHIRWFQLAWVVGFAGYALVLRAVWMFPAGGDAGRWSLWLLGFVLLRVTLLHSVPSDDLRRYVWEGKIQAHGFNPYLIGPDDERLTELRAGDKNWAQINHSDYTAIYPPFAQLVFRAVASVSHSVYFMKAVLVGLEAIALVVLGRWLTSLGVSPMRLTVYALNPLVLTAVAIEGHLDALMLLCLAVTGWAVGARRWYLCGVALGLAISSKVVAVVLLPWLFFRKPLAAGAAIAVVVVTYLPYADSGWHVFDSLRRFSDSGMLSVMAMCAEMVGKLPARLACGAALVAYALWLVRRRCGFGEYAGRMLAGLVLVMPVVHAWYLSWFLLFAWARLRVSWLVLTAAMVVYFEAERNHVLYGAWSMPEWAPIFIAGMFALAWVAEAVWRRRWAGGASSI